ncbi:MAG: GIY-YIG nuclease family protein [Bacteroidetes bacterium]|nr:GIY-YIG nuclease family protein [Bacteroidota bacterium]
MFYVYVLHSQKFDKYYIGQTENLIERLNRHNSGYEKATKPYTPWVIIWSAEKPTRAEAMELELKLKNLSRQRLLEFMTKYS